MTATRSFSFRVLLGTSFFGVIALCLALAYAMQIRFVERSGIEKIKAHAVSQTESVALLLQMDLMSGFYPAVVQRANRTLQLQPEIVGLRIETRGGYVVFESVKGDIKRDNVLEVEKKVLPSSLAGQTAPEDAWIASITAQFSVQAHAELMKRQRRTIAAFGLILALLALGLSAAVSTALSRPIQRLAHEMKRGDLQALGSLAADWGSRWIYEVHDLYAQTHFLAGQNLRYQEELLRRAKELALAEFARQVAHDIRSPLAALETAAADISHIPEEKRVLLRSAAGRIRDIANSLLERYKERSDEAPLLGASAEPCLLSGLVEPVISEKRLQFRPHPRISIEAVWDEHSYGVFGAVQPVEFSRVLSNLINNGVEALERNPGTVHVTLSEQGRHALVTVSDTGKGIPDDILAKLGERGVSHGKADGFGLGLHHARTSCESWGGKLSIASRPGEGTSVTMYVPLAPVPRWFAPRLRLVRGQTVVIVDDDASIHQVWTDRLKSTSAAEVVHLYTPRDLRSWAAANARKAEEALYLLDYELIGHEDTGLGLAEEFGLGRRGVLVTSWHEDAAIVERCLKAGLRIIPKGLARLVPISISEDGPSHWDAILIDDDALVRMNWKLAASKTGIKFKSYSTPAEFMEDSDSLERGTPVYVDAELADGEKGDVESLRIRELGFTEIYLTTGHEPAKFAGLQHLRAVVGKEPPWPSSF